MTIIKAAGNAMFGKVVETSLPNGVIDFMTRFGKVPDVSRQALAQKYFGWTYACANISATRLASTPLRLYATRGTGESSVKNFRTKPVKREEARRLRHQCKGLEHVAGAEDFEELEEHPLLDLLQNVNEQENSFEVKELTSIMLDLTGDAYWMIEKDRMGIPSKFFVLRSQWVRIIPDRETFVKGYWYGYNNAWGTDTRLELAPEDVIHFKYPNPLDPWYGMGPVQAAAYAIENNELREKFMLATMSNMARPDLIVKYLEGELDPKERASVEREWNATFRGAKNAGKVKVIDFRYEIDKVGWNPNELDFNKGEDWILKKICSVFPVPLGLIDSSQMSKAPRSGMEGSDLFMAQFNTLPRCTRIEQKLNEQLTPMYDDRLFLAFDNPVPKDRVMQNNEDTSKLNTYQTTINEIRQRDGLDPVEWGDVPLAPFGIAPLGSSNNAPEDIPGKKPTTIGQEDEAEGESDYSSGGADSSEEDDREMENAEDEEAFGVEKLKGMDLSIAGHHVHPSLAGIPIKIKPKLRNEGGKFDKNGADKVRTDRETARLLRMKSKDNPYGSLCPECGEPAINSCRCAGPHTPEQLARGHGLKCKNGHHWSFTTDKTI
jgi:HK97 family phage portal protein